MIQESFLVKMIFVANDQSYTPANSVYGGSNWHPFIQPVITERLLSLRA